MPTCRLVPLFVLILSVPLVAAAEKPAPPAPPVEMAQMKYFFGNWRCKGEVRTPAGVIPVVARTKIKSELGGHWVSVDMAQRRTKKNPMPMRQRFWYGYDRQKKQFHAAAFNNFGGMHHATTPGWKDDKWVETIDAVGPGGKVKMRATFVKLKPRVFKVSAEVKGPKGWMVVNQTECRK